jgi:hypothetical protein
MAHMTALGRSKANDADTEPSRSGGSERIMEHVWCDEGLDAADARVWLRAHWANEHP